MNTFISFNTRNPNHLFFLAKPCIFKLIGLAVIFTVGFSSPADAVRVTPGNPQYSIHNHTLPYKRMKNQNVVIQGYDLSCGSAALATLFQYYYGDNITEKDILDFILEKREASLKKNIKNPEGLSLFDLKVASEHFKYRAAGFTMDFESLPALAGPVIVHLDDIFGGHFAILKGIRKDRVYLADPARGNVRMTSYQFLKKWNGTIFVVEHTTRDPIKNSPLFLGQVLEYDEN